MLERRLHIFHLQKERGGTKETEEAGLSSSLQCSEQYASTSAAARRQAGGVRPFLCSRWSGVLAPPAHPQELMV